MIAGAQLLGKFSLKGIKKGSTEFHYSITNVQFCKNPQNVDYFSIEHIQGQNSVKPFKILVIKKIRIF